MTPSLGTGIEALAATKRLQDFFREYMDYEQESIKIENPRLEACQHGEIHTVVVLRPTRRSVTRHILASALKRH